MVTHEVTSIHNSYECSWPSWPEVLALRRSLPMITLHPSTDMDLGFKAFLLLGNPPPYTSERVGFYLSFHT